MKYQYIISGAAPLDECKERTGSSFKEVKKEADQIYNKKQENEREISLLLHKAKTFMNER